MLSEVSCQSLGGGGPVRPLQPPVGVPQAGQGRLPAHQGGQAAKGVQEPVGQPVGPGGLQKGQGLGLGAGPGGSAFPLAPGPDSTAPAGPGAWRSRPAPPGAGSPESARPHPGGRCCVVRPMSSATRTRSTWSPNSPVHWKARSDQPLHGGLLDAHQAAAGQVLAQEHTKHRGLVGIFRDWPR